MAPVLHREMEREGPPPGDWSDREIDLIVADYFEMLGMELRGETFVKAQRNAALQAITGRSRGSIEFKHQNISAVLLRLGLPWVPGYTPMANFQRALIDGVERHLDTQWTGWDGRLADVPSPGLAEEETLFFAPPPKLTGPDAELPEPIRRLVRKFDPAARDARNRHLGRRGEELILKVERTALRSAGREDLARRIRWVSEEDGDGAGYDILSFDPRGRERLIEVKTTIGDRITPFYVSENERSLAEEGTDAFRLVRLYDFARTPKAFELVPPLQGQVLLAPVSYRASFQP